MKIKKIIFVLAGCAVLSSCTNITAPPAETAESVEADKTVDTLPLSPHETSIIDETVDVTKNESFPAETFVPETEQNVSLPPETFFIETIPPETVLLETVSIETTSQNPIETVEPTPEPPSGLATNISSPEAMEILFDIHRLLSETNTVSVYYSDVNEEYFFGWNENTIYHSASTVKAAYCLYLTESGADLDRRIPFTSVTGKSASGKLTAESIGKEFTVDELIRYTIRSSDNQAYKLLFDTFGTEDYNRYVASIDAVGLSLSPDSEWAFCSPKELSSVMLRAYSSGELTSSLIDHLKNTEYNAQITAGTSFETAHKYGYNGKKTGFHDTAIVYAENRPYVLTIMTLLDPADPHTFFIFRDLTGLCDRLTSILFED